MLADQCALLHKSLENDHDMCFNIGTCALIRTNTVIQSEI